MTLPDRFRRSNTIPDKYYKKLRAPTVTPPLFSRLRIQIPDQPGVLGRVTTVVGKAGANIVEIVHDRMFLDIPARSTELEVVMETFDHAHVQRVLEALAAEGYVAKLGDVTFGPR